MKNLYIIRGIPGAGKTTLARTLAPLVIEPDMFRYTADMQYKFDSAMNAEVLRKVEDLAVYAVRRLKMPALAIAATHTRVEHIRKYIRLGLDNGYSVTVIECRGDYGNVHGVPESVVARMRAEFETLDAARAKELGVISVIHGE